MRKKKLLFIAVLILGVVAGVFFVDTTPRVPLAVDIVGFTNGPNGRLAIIFRVTNLTERGYWGAHYVEELSRPQPGSVTAEWSNLHTMEYDSASALVMYSHDVKEQMLPIHETALQARLLIRYGRIPTAHELRIDAVLKKLGLRAFYDRGQTKEFITALVEIPAR